eukprot:11314700-Alexandrium_andersonii.AAC.1
MAEAAAGLAPLPCIGLCLSPGLLCVAQAAGPSHGRGAGSGLGLAAASAPAFAAACPATRLGLARLR